MNWICCGSAAGGPGAGTAAGSYERSRGMLNPTCLPSDIIAFVVFCPLRYRLTLRDLSEILALA